MINLKHGDTTIEVEGDKNGYVEVCKHIAAKTHPILNIEMSMPYDKDHSGWVAICDAEDDCDAEDHVRWSMKELLESEPSLEEPMQDPSEMPMIVRDSASSPWRVV